MRIAYVCADRGIPVNGGKGGSIHVQEIIRAMTRRGCEVELFAARCDGALPDDLRAVRIHQLPEISQTQAGTEALSVLKANESLTDQLDNEGPFDLVYERYSLWSYAGVESAASFGIPGVLEVNAPLIEEQARYRVLNNRELAEQIARRVFRAASAIIAVSEEVAQSLTTDSETVGRVHVVPNGVDPERFVSARRSVTIKDDQQVTIGFVGTLKPWHGVDLLIQAFARVAQQHPNVRLLIVGDGPERQSLETLANGHVSENRVKFTGFVDPTRIPEILASMDIAVAPYPPLDQFYFSPLKLYEYMAAGLAIVASRIGAPARVLGDGNNGRLYDPGSIDALAQILDELVGDPDQRQQLGWAARRVAQEKHTWQAVLSRIFETVDHLDPVAG